MYNDNLFQQLVTANYPTGEVIGSDRFLVTVKGLDGVGVGALVVFESGQRGMVRELTDETVLILNLQGEETKLGSLVVLQDHSMKADVGEALIGRIVTPLGEPLDGKGPIRYEAQWPVYNEAPGLIERELLKDQLSSGVTIVDFLFPIVLGQRIAILGDAKSGKTSFLLQLGMNQTGTDRIVVYVLIGKRRVEIGQTIATLRETGAMANSILIIADMFDSLAQSYLAPYIGCAIAEYLWAKKGKDVVVIYDDLTSHAKVYREVSLLTNVSPGRDSYPGDMFYAHSSLLERAGKLKSNSKTLTALPVVITPGDDITAFLPTSIMSMTDGQIIFDLQTFRQNIRPAVNVGLSVSRVGGRALNNRQKLLSATVTKRLAEYRQAREFAHFTTDITPESKHALQLGMLIYEVFRQGPRELHLPLVQELMLETVIASGGTSALNVSDLKKKAKEVAPKIKNAVDIDLAVQQLLQTTRIGGTL
ncbi:MAG TPA: sodium-transporting two-sector ATPase [Candidatus Saccharimonadales bacterium]|nr:sodium-transporting two-sector ATPase [Candidatus Saccharimonadales bacterium]